MQLCTIFLTSSEQRNIVQLCTTPCPALAPGKMAAPAHPGPENFQDCPASPRPENALSLTVTPPRPQDFTPCAPRPTPKFYAFAPPRPEAKKGSPCIPGANKRIMC